MLFLQCFWCFQAAAVLNVLPNGLITSPSIYFLLCEPMSRRCQRSALIAMCTAYADNSARLRAVHELRLLHKHNKTNGSMDLHVCRCSAQTTHHGTYATATTSTRMM